MEGYIVDLLRHLAEKAGFKYELTVRADGQYGQQQDDGSYNGMIGALITGVSHHECYSIRLFHLKTIRSMTGMCLLHILIIFPSRQYKIIWRLFKTGPYSRLALIQEWLFFKTGPHSRLALFQDWPFFTTGPYSRLALI